MKLDSVIIKNFRSIETARIANCDGLNVLIGKNNSGKSNILSAINAFFICLKEGNLANLNPPIGIDTDFFKGSKSEILDSNIQPIEITQIYLLSSDEIISLKSAIIKETPQMKTAVDGITSSRLSATVKVNKSNSPFSFISKLALIGEIFDGNDCSENILLTVSNNAAFEISNRLLNKKNLERNIKLAKEISNEISSSDFERVLEMPERDRPRYFVFRSFGFPPGFTFDSFTELERAIRTSKDYDSFKT